MELGGLHHVTAITGRAADNLAFYTRTLGLRLVKKTVNQDDPGAYHLFYADAEGRPGTEMTFFEWPDLGPAHAGTGTVAETAFRVAGGHSALEHWMQWLDDRQVARADRITDEPGGSASLSFHDHENQPLRLVAHAASGDGGPGTAPPPILGLDRVTLAVRQPAPTARLLTEILGLTPAADDPAGSRFLLTASALDGGLPAQEVRLSVPTAARPGQAGIGGVHHIAFRVPDADMQAQWRQRLLDARVAVSDIIDRFYFRSIYFREPGGVLFEIATDGPGFAADEDAAHLGERLSLPPFLEPFRTRIEANLLPLARET